MSRREIREKEEKELKDRKEQKKREKKKEKRNKKNKKKEKKKNANIFIKILKFLLKALLVLFLILVLLLGILIGWLGVTTNWDFSKMVKKGAQQAALIATGQSLEDVNNLPPIYCLVMGVSVDIDVPLTDTIILCAYYPKTQQASMLSIPRDTFVGKSESTAGGFDKINSLYQQGGPEKTVEAVEKLTGIEIPNYVVIDTQSLIKVVDEIGGVYFDVPINMNYNDKGQGLHINLSKGYQKIDGKKAEQLLRFRHNDDGSSYPYEYGDNDIGRMKTQRAFITETIKQTLQLKNIDKIKELINITYEYVKTNADFDEVMKYSPGAIDFDISRLKSDTLPGVPANFGPQKLSFFRANKKETATKVKEMFSFDPSLSVDDISIEHENLNVQVLNGSGNQKITEDVIDLLEDSGYNVKNSGITTISNSSKIINRTNKQNNVVAELSDVVGFDNVDIGKDNMSCDFTIVIGQDYASYLNI